MSDEKELLLKLLVEKYLEGQKPKPVEVHRGKIKRVRNYHQDHKWTKTEKIILAQMRNEGQTWEAIANRLNLRRNQCQSMWSNLQIHQRNVGR